MKQAFPLIALLVAFPAFAEETRQLDAHEHGVGALDIAIYGTTVAMAFEAPGADIVGFEYAAKSDADHAAIDTALAALGAPLELFVMPDAAACGVVEAQADLEGGDGHEGHHEDHHDEGGHDTHADHDEDDHADDAGHTEFHAEYTLTCDNPDALTEITFAYFNAFPNAQEVDVQIITISGAHAFEVARDTPTLDLGR
ncbi:DUF2796 domain-containing protein [Pseudoruegeria sp. SK021]|uniref:DUF2796 domain-containing protein n=1 Tax=Pseudoruegeria sp. SK021 TaxID=1933035 RepID=UPI000A25DE5D|nr:DUF2796 domain-containing protein [Pseudoruegeria sp. SK021]OSP55795.1 hypothetical protein BV911_05280 [Pseudoruegeria sp. SK021]